MKILWNQAGFHISEVMDGGNEEVGYAKFGGKCAFFLNVLFEVSSL